VPIRYELALRNLTRPLQLNQTSVTFSFTLASTLSLNIYISSTYQPHEHT